MGCFAERGSRHFLVCPFPRPSFLNDSAGFLMMSNAIRFIASKGNKSPSAGSISLACYVKPGASAKREGINSVSDDGVELCVSAQAKEGEANKAVQKLMAEVRYLSSIYPRL